MIDVHAFKDYFKSQIEYHNSFGMVMRFNNARVDSRIKSFVFVEGSTDRRFYANTTDPKLSQNAEYFYKITTDNDVDNYVGKDAVFYSYKVINQNDSLKKEMNKCVFIVDRDYSENIVCKRFPMSDDDYKYFSMTKGHSFEDYFIEEGNVRAVFLYYGLSDENVIDFTERFTEFFRNTYEYFALCGVIADLYEDLSTRYKRKYSMSDIVLLDFCNDRIVDNEKMNEEKRRMRAYLRENGKKDYSKAIIDRVSQSPIYIRGHNVYEYLQRYLKYYHGVEFDDKTNYSDYKRIVRSIQVAF